MHFSQYIYVIYIVINSVNSLIVENEREIQGKVIVVTGGAQGIGFAIADNFLKNGAKIAIILDINVTKGIQAEKALNSKYGSNKAEYIECDVTKDLDYVSKIIKKKYGYTDILVNCAGIIGENKPRKLLLTNAVALIEFSLKYNECMRKDKCGKGGTIINIASVVAHDISPFIITYRASKYAISGFSQSLGQDYNYQKTGVRVLTICPGPTNTTLGIGLYASVSKEELAALLKIYKYSILQAPDYVGKGVVEVFKNAESGTSWDIEDEKRPFESSKTTRIIVPDFS